MPRVDTGTELLVESVDSELNRNISEEENESWEGFKQRMRLHQEGRVANIDPDDSTESMAKDRVLEEGVEDDNLAKAAPYAWEHTSLSGDMHEEKRAYPQSLDCTLENRHQNEVMREVKLSSQGLDESLLGHLLHNGSAGEEQATGQVACNVGVFIANSEQHDQMCPVLLEPLSSDDDEEGHSLNDQPYFDRNVIEWLSNPRPLHLRDKDSERAFTFALSQAAPYVFQWFNNEDQLVGFMCIEDIKTVQQSVRNPSSFVIIPIASGDTLRNSGGLENLLIRTPDEDISKEYVSGLSSLLKMTHGEIGP